MSLRKRNQQYGFTTRSDTNQAVQPQKQTRSLKFWIEGEEGLYYLCGENKGADQLCSYCTADLRLCFRTCRLSSELLNCQLLSLGDFPSVFDFTQETNCKNSRERNRGSGFVKPEYCRI